LDFGDIKFISEEDHKKISERSRVNRGDILFAMIGSIGNPVIVDTSLEFSIKNVALFKFINNELTYNIYLHKYLQISQEKMKAISSGAVQNFVSLNFLRNYPFPLPPIAEQKRIVEKIDSLMILCDQLEKERNLKNEKRIDVHATAINSLIKSKE
jgi:type I restriction enzyme, S subunit